MFFTRSKNCFLSERELKKALRDTLTRAAWLGPSSFLLVRSEHAHASYPGLFFRPPGFSPYMGREKGEFRDWTTAVVVELASAVSGVFLSSHVCAPSASKSFSIMRRVWI